MARDFNLFFDSKLDAPGGNPTMFLSNNGPSFHLW